MDKGEFNNMVLWTIQPLEVWNELNSKGHFICNPKKSDFISNEPEFRFAYDWLNLKMEQQIGRRPKEVEYPIWSWYKRDWKHKKPDLRNVGLGNKGDKSVCIEVDISDNQVVLSDFDAWHFVLNKWYLDDALCEEDWEKSHNELERYSIQEQEQIIQKSWDKVFNISPFKNEWMQRGRYIQATFWVLYLKDVKKVQFFTCR